MTLSALICDDEIEQSNLVVRYFSKYCTEHNINYYYDEINDGNEILNSKTKYDIAFLDIEIGNINGLKVAETLKKRNKYIIIFFITDYEKYIDDAMNLFALRFLKKPLDYSRFYSGLDKAIELINEDVVEFYLKENNSLVKINSSEIIYIETMNHKTKVVTNDKTYFSSNLIDFWQKELVHISFYRVHKSFIINLNYIKKYQRNEVVMTSNNIIGISYRKQVEFRKYFYEYLKRRK